MPMLEADSVFYKRAGNGFPEIPPVLKNGYAMIFIQSIAKMDRKSCGIFRDRALTEDENEKNSGIFSGNWIYGGQTIDVLQQAAGSCSWL
ncbi:hypothetical protein LIZ87_20130 [Lacrimispora sp. 210928-DFI.3.58]|nr:hypothetical protein [Lacrimispora sp. 210928-DFI.3.58]